MWVNCNRASVADGLQAFSFYGRETGEGELVRGRVQDDELGVQLASGEEAVTGEPHGTEFGGCDAAPEGGLGERGPLRGLGHLLPQNVLGITL